MGKQLENLYAGKTIKHIKRGSLYKILGTVKSGEYWQDEEAAEFILITQGNTIQHTKMIKAAHLQEHKDIYGRELTLLFPVIVQVDPNHDWHRYSTLVLYRSLDGAFPGQTWARPQNEFTEDRFTPTTTV